jgi:hypothetical protein
MVFWGSGSSAAPVRRNKNGAIKATLTQEIAYTATSLPIADWTGNF